MPQRRTAIAETIRQRLFSSLHLGVLRPGDRLPSVRDLAAELDVDRRVVLAAFRELESDGLVELRERSGIYLANPGAPGGETLSRRSRWVVDFLLRGLAEGIAAPETPDRLQQYLGTLRLRAACVECNDDQIDSLAAELRADYGLEPSGVDIETLVSNRAVPSEVRRTDILVTTPFHAGPVKEVAERLGKPWVAVSLRANVFTEAARMLPAGPVYFVVRDPRFAEKLGKIFEAAPGAANLRAFVVGRDLVERIPAGVATYLTGAARERLGPGSPLAARVTPESRAFAAESARDLLMFVVRANMEALAGRRAGAGPSPTSAVGA